MPVAKSYQGLKILTEPYKRNGKMYITIETKTGKSKDVRWYTENEYEKLYPEVKREIKPQKQVLGFEKGYITIFRNIKEEDEYWFSYSICRHAKNWGWYIISTEEIPNDLPEGIEPVKLYWTAVGNENGLLKPEVEVRKAVMNILYPSKEISKSQGKVGERIERKLTIIENVKIENKYGTSTIHIMKDNDNNLYYWKTSARSWPENTIKTVRGTVKEYSVYKGEKCTVLTRCLEK